MNLIINLNKLYLNNGNKFLATITAILKLNSEVKKIWITI